MKCIVGNPRQMDDENVGNLKIIDKYRYVAYDLHTCSFSFNNEVIQILIIQPLK
jgi:hypothetical protein